MIYIVYPKDCGFTREQHPTTACVRECQSASPRAAWDRREKQAAECGVTLNPADYVAVGGTETGELTRHGAPVIAVNWNDMHDCTQFGGAL